MARKKNAQKRNNLSRTLIIFGLLLLLIGTLTHAQIYYRFVITQNEKPQEVIYQAPSLLKIPSQKLDVKIDQGGIVKGEWVLSKTNALYLPTSGRLGEGYNTIIYAHNTNKLFRKLGKVKAGDSITVVDSLGKEFNYRVFAKDEVKATDLKALYSDEKDILTLFTCDGWFDRERLVVRARLDKSL